MCRTQELKIEEEEDEELRKALRLSLNERNSPLMSENIETVNVDASDSSDSELEAAIRLSLASPTTPVSTIGESDCHVVDLCFISFLFFTFHCNIPFIT